MRTAKLRAYWDQSPSTDVTQYFVLVINEDNQDTILDKTVSMLETEVLFEVPEKTNITVTVIATDGVFDSDPVSTSFQVGDLTKPQPVGFVGVSIVEVSDTEDEEVEAVEAVEGGDLQNGDNENFSL